MTGASRWTPGGIRVGTIGVVLVMVALLLAGTLGVVTHARAASSPSLAVYGYISPTSQIIVSGDGFPTQEQATVSIGGVPAGTVFIHSLDPWDGSIDHPFRAPITIPATVTPGAQVLAVTGQTSGVVVKTTIMVRQNWAEFGFDATGSRYNPYESVISASNVATLVPGWSATVQNSAEEALVNGVVYVSNGDLLQANTEASGSLIWQTYGQPNTPPAVADGLIFFGVSGLSDFQASYASTGAFAWHYLGNSAVGENFSPAVVTNGVVYTGSTDGKLYAFHATGCGASTCQPIWAANLRGSVNPNAAVTVRPPAVVNGLVYTATAYYDSSNTLQGNLSVLDATSGSVLWTAPLASAAGGLVVVVGGYIYVSTWTGAVQVFSAAGCGQPTCSPLWSAVTNGNVSLATAPIVVGGTLYVGSENGRLYAFNATGCGAATCSPLWTSVTLGAVIEAPASANGVVFVGSNDGYLYAFNGAGCGQSTCSWLWRYNTGYAVFTSPIVANGVLYIGIAISGMLLTFHPSGAATKGLCSPGHQMPIHRPVRGVCLS